MRIGWRGRWRAAGRRCRKLKVHESRGEISGALRVCAHFWVAAAGAGRAAAAFDSAAAGLRSAGAVGATASANAGGKWTCRVPDRGQCVVSTGATQGRQGAPLSLPDRVGTGLVREADGERLPALWSPFAAGFEVHSGTE